MLKVVSNTTPILSLLKIGELEMLRKVYGEIIIPNAVFEEIESGKSKKYHTDLSKLQWINILEIKDQHTIKYFLDLDRGEAES